MGKLAFVFPGQGSQTVGMGLDLYEENEAARKIFQEADEALGYSLSKLMFEGPAEKLTLTMNAQPALLTASYALYQALAAEGFHPDYAAGHSLGEYSALAASGSMSFHDAVYTVHKRGEFMEEAVPAGEGSMSAVLGMERAALESLTKEITEAGQPVQLANINCPGQIVISGTAEGVKLAEAKAKENGAKRAIPLNVSGPFHSELMKPAADKLKDVLGNTELKTPEFPVISNVTAKAAGSAEEIKNLLIEQLYSPVLWEDSIRTLLAEGVDTFVEVGSGRVLGGLIRKIDRKAVVYSVSGMESLKQTVDALRGN